MKDRNLIRISMLCILTITFAVAVTAQGQNTPGHNPEHQAGSRAKTTTPSSPQMSFESRVMEINSAEIQIGRLAATKSQNDRVKGFAQMMIKDHSEALTKFQKLQEGNRGTAAATTKRGEHDNRTDAGHAASSGGMPPLSMHHQQLMTRLQGVNGSDFEREYINAMVAGHREAVQLFEQETGSASGKAASPSTSGSEVKTL